MRSTPVRKYIEALETLELAALMAMKYRGQVNRAICGCWATIRGRVTNELNRQIFDGMVNQFMPHGALCMLRRQLDAAVSEG